MDPDKIQAAIVATLKEVQILSGREWKDLSAGSVPINDLDGFDSLLSVEVTLMVEEKLGCGELTEESIFISGDGQRALSIGEITTKVQNMISKMGGSK